MHSECRYCFHARSNKCYQEDLPLLKVEERADAPKYMHAQCSHASVGLLRLTQTTGEKMG